ncbi:bifunctional 2-polyprenyl-6-hydroxyphenol methylase/3-demethylubiquinol 3-O-methyltransferase UbiG [Streptomyces sp. PTY087I2]|uniref:class I SAM-dependent methyltransferase n=1 Tax=Streptomyces sp. PTY087I2 TaxID=1819298 RepID=UPI00080BDD0E|nr:class I SAM-dependent methyltransferase [Streptomyces sp. PTY087I2]OCC09393.1 Cypemycin methyltransferase [Streptomyces sp. PTY087I2]
MGYDIAAYGDKRPDYDTMLWELRQDEAEASAFLAGLATDGRALELGIGTGRVALPLARHGVSVTGIEGSSSMVDQLKRKIADESVDVVVGDFADVAVDQTFDLVYCISETFFLLPTQESQIACVRNVAERLTSGGQFVVQATVPQHGLFCKKESTHTRHVGEGSAVVTARRHNRAEQRVDVQNIVFDSEGNTFHPLHYRYVWPSELDLMARLAGLGLVSRTGDWNGSGYDASGGYVAVYRKP